MFRFTLFWAKIILIIAESKLDVIEIIRAGLDCGAVGAAAGSAEPGPSALGSVGRGLARVANMALVSEEILLVILRVSGLAQPGRAAGSFHG